MPIIDNPTLKFSNRKLSLNDQVLLDLSDPFKNLSHIPGRKHDDTGEAYRTVLDLISENNKRHLEFGFVTDIDPLFYSVIDAMLSDFFVQHGSPLKVCEIGCNRGILSFHIAPLLAEYDPKADYVCVCDSIGNESNNTWLDAISSVYAPEGLALVASDFCRTFLRDDYFDLVVINGTLQIPNPACMLKEAVRISDPNGRMICFSYGQYLLDDSFKLVFNKRKEYRFSEECVIFSAETKDAWNTN